MKRVFGKTSFETKKHVFVPWIFLTSAEYFFYSIHNLSGETSKSVALSNFLDVSFFLDLLD